MVPQLGASSKKKNRDFRVLLEIFSFAIVCYYITIERMRNILSCVFASHGLLREQSKQSQMFNYSYFTRLEGNVIYSLKIR